MLLPSYLALQNVRPIWPKNPIGRIGRVSKSVRSSTKLASTILDPSEKGTVVPLYRSEGLFAVEKPLNWTSQDVVSYIRGILERDARKRGAKPSKITSRRNKNRIIRVGHGGTLDPLATGVLVIGVGRGTKDLQRCERTLLSPTAPELALTLVHAGICLDLKDTLQEWSWGSKRAH